jgi:cytochrome c oxidase subunit 2
LGVLLFLFGGVGSALAAPGTSTAPELNTLFYLVLAFGLGIGVFVGVAMVYTILKFRKRKGHETVSPKLTTSNHRLEAAWTIVPALILLLVGILAFQTLQVTDAIPQNPDVIVTVIGHQWWWEFYANFTSNGTSVHTLDGTFTVAANMTVKLIVVAADVMHSFLVPQIFGLHIDAVPGHVNTFWFKPTTPGNYDIVCTQFCGTGHYQMVGTLVVTPS